VHGHNHDARARHYALRAVRPSPARAEAPEPDVWLPILDITGELEALDLTAESEQLDLETTRADFDAELEAHQSDFWSTAPLGLESAIAQVTFAEPPVVDEAPAPLAAPEAQPESAPVPRAETGFERSGLRTRLVGTFLVLALIGAVAAVIPGVVGASPPQRHITISLDGQTVDRTVRVATVGDVLAQENIVVSPDDRVVPAPATELREDMRIEVLRAFPVDVEVDGAVKTVRTTMQTRGELRKELGIDPALVARGPSELAAGSAIAFRTPHDVTLQVDGRTIDAPRSAALDVAELLREQGIPLGSRDEVMPAPATRLSDGMRIHVYRLADDQIAERVSVPFTTEVRDDPNLQVGQSKTIQAGVPGVRRDIYQVTTRDDGTVVAKNQIGYEVLTPPVAEVIVKGTQPVPPRATGSATWYGTGPGPGTCAHLSLKFGTMVTLTNRDTGAVAQCRVQDRGPETWTGHIIDLSPDVFRRLAPLSQGIVPNLALSW